MGYMTHTMDRKRLPSVDVKNIKRWVKFKKKKNLLISLKWRLKFSTFYSPD